ncbi:MAG: DUF1957 domain-containing protein [Candidatus Eisenbacteria bacterium]|nr:DUF1957 domain-containing protein [Candidatus Latescibacterota bacterium]MBD3302179.1 DUF1957 domain-containing protein [Candidatus Eisenbacteria bacterium]
MVLHAHLPFVRHPEHPRFLEEDWLFEAITETYLPLLEALERLVDDCVPFRLALSISPTLAAMLDDPLLQDRYLVHLDDRIDLAAREVSRTRLIPPLHALARSYHRIFRRTRRRYAERYGRRLLPAFRALQETGAVELITCGATHGFLPLMSRRPNTWRAQIHVAVAEHARHFGRPPSGLWLPECGYDRGIEEILHEAGLRYFFVETHGITRASPPPRWEVHEPLRTPSGVAAFGRDPDSAASVWSARDGYPGDPRYREFYRDVGFDLEYGYLRPYLHGDGARTGLGIKYYRITGGHGPKQPYDFGRAAERAAMHAEDFLEKRKRRLAELRGRMDRPPLIVAPYDAELFGHWWFEGPIWIEELLRRAARDADAIRLVTPSEHLGRTPEQATGLPCPSSWGRGGFAEVWLNDRNDWIYPHLHRAEGRLVELANRFARSAPAPPAERALSQAARELLLAQSSDWAFIIGMGTMVDYATGRIEAHLGRFDMLVRALLEERIDERALSEFEEKDNLFPSLDYRVFADRI